MNRLWKEVKKKRRIAILWLLCQEKKGVFISNNIGTIQPIHMGFGFCNGSGLMLTSCAWSSSIQ